jgi:hypothetical protein
MGQTVILNPRWATRIVPLFLNPLQAERPGAMHHRSKYGIIGTRRDECQSPRTRKGGAMTFEEVLDQAIALLQRRGRLTYRTLKRQFQLDDSLSLPPPSGGILAACKAAQLALWRGWGAVPSGAGGR